MSLLELFCAVDDFCKAIETVQEGRLISPGKQQRRRAGQLSDSEALTIIIHFHQSQYRNFKAYYQQHVQVYLRAEFPHLVSYGRFVQRHACWAGCAGICSVVSDGVLGSVLSMPLSLPCVTIDALISTKSSKALPHAAKARWAGVLASNCT